MHCSGLGHEVWEGLRAWAVEQEENTKTIEGQALYQQATNEEKKSAWAEDLVVETGLQITDYAGTPSHLAAGKVMILSLGKGLSQEGW